MTPAARASPHPLHSALGILQRRGLYRAADQDGPRKCGGSCWVYRPETLLIWSRRHTADGDVPAIAEATSAELTPSRSAHDAKPSSRFLVARGELDGRTHRGDDRAGFGAVPRAAHRVVVGPRLLQSVVLVADPVGWADLGSPGRCLCRGGPVRLEDELSGADPASLVPFYGIYPDPRTLLVIQNIMFWWIIPAAYTLARSESRSEPIAVSAAALVPFLPLLWPLVWNDFRELQLAMPFVLWAVQGIRGRQVGLAAVGVLGMLACRQEFAVMVATFAFLPPRRRKTSPEL